MNKLAQSKITNPILDENLQTLLSEDPTGYLKKIIPNLVGLAYIVGVLIFVFVLITGAIQWMTASKDKAALEGARGRITNAIVGLVILFSILAIIKVLESFFKVNILTIDLGPLYIQ